MELILPTHSSDRVGFPLLLSLDFAAEWREISEPRHHKVGIWGNFEVKPHVSPRYYVVVFFKNKLVASQVRFRKKFKDRDVYKESVVS